MPRHDPTELDFSHERDEIRESKSKLHHIDKAWRDIQFERYINKIYANKKKALSNGMYNSHRALGHV